MPTKQAYLAIIALTLLVSICFSPLVFSEKPAASAQTPPLITPLQTLEPENISVNLLTPINDANLGDNFNVSFTFEPKINGTDKFYGAELILNGTVVAASNQTALKPYEINTIYYVFSENSTCTWNIGLRNSTNTVYALNDYALTIEIPKPIGIAVSLKAPDNGTTVTNSLNCSFVFVPTIFGSDHFTSASLVINGIEYATNQTKLIADENNTIYFKFNNNGTYNWNIRLQNDTNTVSAPSNYNFTVSVYVAPEATSTPAPTATSTPVPTAAPTNTESPPTPTPAPDNESLSTWAIVIIIVLVISVLLVVVLIMLRRRQSQI
jgi:hypothetical protein